MDHNYADNAHHVWGIVSVLELHTAFYKIHTVFIEKQADKPDKWKALLSIYLKELLKKNQISLT